jgi:protein-tyrosine phosphatase
MLSGAVELPDGVRVRGRGLRNGTPAGEVPEFGLYLGTARLRARYGQGLGWEREWVDWPDFWVPRDFDAACASIIGLHGRAARGQRVEVACGGGVGRTGTVMACLAVVAGVDKDEAVGWARAHYHPKAVEMPWQRRWVSRFAAKRSS